MYTATAKNSLFAQSKLNAKSGGLCVSVKDTADSTTGAQAKALLQVLQRHGRKNCGSVGVVIRTNDLSRGSFTVD